MPKGNFSLPPGDQNLERSNKGVLYPLSSCGPIISSLNLLLFFLLVYSSYKARCLNNTRISSVKIYARLQTVWGREEKCTLPTQWPLHDIPSSYYTSESQIQYKVSWHYWAQATKSRVHNHYLPFIQDFAFWSPIQWINIIIFIWLWGKLRHKRIKLTCARSYSRTIKELSWSWSRSQLCCQSAYYLIHLLPSFCHSVSLSQFT